MKTFKTALLASAFALASTMAFAQTAAGPTGTSAQPKSSMSSGAAAGGTLGTVSGPTGTSAQPQAGARANVNAAGHSTTTGAAASDSDTMQKRHGKTTGNK